MTDTVQKYPRRGRTTSPRSRAHTTWLTRTGTNAIHPGRASTLPTDHAALFEAETDALTDHRTHTASESGGSYTVHTVVEGDSLSEIAPKHVDDSDAWPAIDRRGLIATSPSHRTVAKMAWGITTRSQALPVARTDRFR